MVNGDQLFMMSYRPVPQGGADNLSDVASLAGQEPMIAGDGEKVAALDASMYQPFYTPQPKSAPYAAEAKDASLARAIRIVEGIKQQTEDVPVVFKPSPVPGEITKMKEATLREKAVSATAGFFKDTFGFDNYQAQTTAEKLLGGPAAPGGIGLIDLSLIGSAPFMTQEGGQQAARGIREGSILDAVIGTAIGLAPGAPALAAARTASKTAKQRKFEKQMEDQGLTRLDQQIPEQQPKAIHTSPYEFDSPKLGVNVNADKAGNPQGVGFHVTIGKTETAPAYGDKTYDVTLPEGFMNDAIHLDKPLQDQSPSVLKKLADAGLLENANMSANARHLFKSLGEGSVASDKLNSIGIPGAVYDINAIEGVKAKKAPEYVSAVIFDPSTVKTTRIKPLNKISDEDLANQGVENPISELDALGNILAGDETQNRIFVEKTLTKSINNHIAGKTSQTQFVNEMSTLQKQLMMKQVERKLNPAEEKRGLNNFLAVIHKEVANNRLNRESADIVEWMLRKNPSLADDLAISFNKAKASHAFASGEYQYPDKRIIVKAINMLSDTNPENILVLPHEFLHHTERMLPNDVQKGINQLWWKRTSDRLLEAIKSNDTLMIDYLKAAMSNDSNELLRSFKELASEKRAANIYQYASSSEFWAENGSRIMKSRATGDLGAKARSYYDELAEKTKSVFGMDSTDPIYKAIRNLKNASSSTDNLLINKQKVEAATGMTRGEKVATAIGGASVIGVASIDPRERRMRERANIQE